MNCSINSYKSIVFDCDGVILNSNLLKLKLFMIPLLGVDVANELKNYHLANGGVSRYYKFDYLLNSILPKFTHLKLPNIDDLLQLYSHNVKSKLLGCEIASQLKDLRFATRASTGSFRQRPNRVKRSI